MARPQDSSGAGRPLLAVEASGSGEPLVLIHGLATTRMIWTPVSPALARTRRVVTLDVPGFGDSAPVGPGFELEAVAERIARGLAARGIPVPFDVVGHSLGAGIAVALAATRPRSVSTLVLVAPAGLVGVPARGARLLSGAIDPFLAARRALAPLTDLDWGRRLLLAFAAADGATLSPTQARLMLAASAGAHRSAEAFVTIAGTDLRPMLERVAAPVGVIWGARDRTVPPVLARVVERVRPDAPIVMIEDAGHVVMVERPELFATELDALVSRLRKQSTSRRQDPSTVV